VKQHQAVPVRALRTAFILAAFSLLGACAPRLEPGGPAIQAPALLDTQIMLADGAALPVRRWLPDDAPRAVIVALHGFNDYSRAFEQPATYWASRGIATYAFDQRGFGNAPNRGIWAGHDTMVADAAAAIGLIRTRHPGRPVFVAGESMGGAIAMIAASQGMLKADGLILVAPALRGRPYLGVIPRAMLWLGARVIPWYPLTGRGLRIQASDNIPMLRALGADPLIIKETRVDAIKGLVDSMDAAIASAAEIRIPSLVLYGARDELVPKKPTFDMIAALPPGISHRPAVYRSGWHLLLRDLKAHIVLDDILAWIADRSAPLPSGADKAARDAMAATAAASPSNAPNR
jgi:alpha-beta hydrolase superfamily lysophospholipase